MQVVARMYFDSISLWWHAEEALQVLWYKWYKDTLLRGVFCSVASYQNMVSCCIEKRLRIPPTVSEEGLGLWRYKEQELHCI